MQQFEYTIQSPEGLHAKPAMMMTKFAKSIPSKIIVQYQGKKADARNIMALFALGAKKGAVIQFTVNGDHEVEDLESLKDFCRNNL